MSRTEEKGILRKQIWGELARLTGPEMERSDEALFERFLTLPEVPDSSANSFC